MPCQQEEPHGARPQAWPIGRCEPRAYFLSHDSAGGTALFILHFPKKMGAHLFRGRVGTGVAWREAAAQSEVLRAFQPCPLSGKPDIGPTPPNDRV